MAGSRLSPGVEAAAHIERERARADAAEARAEELRWAEVAARSDGGSWKSRFKACRRRLSEAVEETKEVNGKGLPPGSGAPGRCPGRRGHPASTRSCAPGFDPGQGGRPSGASYSDFGSMGDAEARARSLSDEVFWLRHARGAKAGKEKLKARLAKLRAAGATLSNAAQLRGP